LFLLVDGERVVAAFAHRRIREKPLEGGVSVYRESIALEPDLATRSARLLGDVGWRGAAMIELRRSPEGKVVVMEVNGRLWGSLQLAIDAGVDFPSLLVALFLGHSVSPVNSYRVGIRTRWEWGDIDHLIARLRRLLQGGVAPDGAPRFLRLLLEFVAGFVRADDRLEVWDRHDLRPFVCETLQWFKGQSA